MIDSARAVTRSWSDGPERPRQALALMFEPVGRLGLRRGPHGLASARGEPPRTGSIRLNRRPFDAFRGFQKAQALLEYPLSYGPRHPRTTSSAIGAHRERCSVGAGSSRSSAVSIRSRTGSAASASSATGLTVSLSPQLPPIRYACRAGAAEISAFLIPIRLILAKGRPWQRRARS